MAMAKKQAGLTGSFKVSANMAFSRYSSFLSIYSDNKGTGMTVDRGDMRFDVYEDRGGRFISKLEEVFERSCQRT